MQNYGYLILSSVELFANVHWKRMLKSIQNSIPSYQQTNRWCKRETRKYKTEYGKFCNAFGIPRGNVWGSWKYLIRYQNVHSIAWPVYLCILFLNWIFLNDQNIFYWHTLYIQKMNFLIGFQVFTKSWLPLPQFNTWIIDQRNGLTI